jgi:hypothetical protein
MTVQCITRRYMGFVCCNYYMGPSISFPQIQWARICPNRCIIEREITQSLLACYSKVAPYASRLGKSIEFPEYYRTGKLSTAPQMRSTKGALPNPPDCPRLGPSPSDRSSIGDFLIRLVGICLYQPTIGRACDRLKEFGASFNQHLRLLSPPIRPGEGSLFIYLFISMRW